MYMQHMSIPVIQADTVIMSLINTTHYVVSCLIFLPSNLVNIISLG